MLSELVNTLVELGASNRKPFTMPRPGDSHVSLMVSADGKTTTLEHDPPSRQHTVTDMESLKAAQETFASEGPVIWVSFEKIILVLDDAVYRDNTVKLPLTANPIFQLLQNFSSTKDPKKLVRFLKLDCNGAAIEPHDLDLAISNLKFRTEDEMSRDISKTTDKMGQSIRSEVTGADKVPDLVTFTFLPWPSIEESYQQEVTVPCQLYIDPTERSISLKPLPGAILAAQTEATRVLAAMIKTQWNPAETTVLCGTP